MLHFKPALWAQQVYGPHYVHALLILPCPSPMQFIMVSLPCILPSNFVYASPFMMRFLCKRDVGSSAPSWTSSKTSYSLVSLLEIKKLEIEFLETFLYCTIAHCVGGGKPKLIGTKIALRDNDMLLFGVIGGLWPNMTLMFSCHTFLPCMFSLLLFPSFIKCS